MPTALPASSSRVASGESNASVSPERSIANWFIANGRMRQQADNAAERGEAQAVGEVDEPELHLDPGGYDDDREHREDDERRQQHRSSARRPQRQAELRLRHGGAPLDRKGSRRLPARPGWPMRRRVPADGESSSRPNVNRPSACSSVPDVRSTNERQESTAPGSCARRGSCRAHEELRRDDRVRRPRAPRVTHAGIGVRRSAAARARPARRGLSSSAARAAGRWPEAPR